MISINTLRKKTFAIYGLGVTGKSVINFFRTKKIKEYAAWDDIKSKRDQFKKKLNKEKFIRYLENADFIIVSPGIKI